MKRAVLLVACLSVGASAAFAARLALVRGTPEVLIKAEERWVATRAVDGMTVRSASRVRCGAGSTVMLVTDNGHRVRIFPRSEIAVDRVDGDDTSLELVIGKLRSWVKKLQARGKFAVRTPVAVCSVRGTDFAVEYGEDRKTKVEVYEGSVSARDEKTGAEALVGPGTFLLMTEGQAPAAPQRLPDGGDGEKVSAPAVINETREEARAEIFQELSREAVLSRSADEVKLAEYQNGKALVDASGSRVRLEEYVVRTTPREFKYVVLNTRQDRFDFGKILFTFNDTLPADLTEATRTMFHADTAARPRWWLTDVLSVMSNTIDHVNEEAHGGQMFVDNPSYPSSWSLGFKTYVFSANGKTWWSYADANANGVIDAGEIRYYNVATGMPLNFLSDFSYDTAAGKYYYLDSAGSKVYFNEFSQPSGANEFHFLQRNNYRDGQWIAAEDYIIDDQGKIIGLGDLKDQTSAGLKKKAYESNFERVYTCSSFQGRKIDLVFSAKLLMDAGILSMPDFSR